MRLYERIHQQKIRRMITKRKNILKRVTIMKRNRKTLGVDDISNGILKLKSKDIVKEVTKLFDGIIQKEKISEE